MNKDKKFSFFYFSNEERNKLANVDIYKPFLGWEAGVAGVFGIAALSSLKSHEDSSCKRKRKIPSKGLFKIYFNLLNKI